MSKKVPPKGVWKQSERTSARSSITGKYVAKKSARHVTPAKDNSCFDGAGALSPTKAKVGQPKKR